MSKNSSLPMGRASEKGLNFFSGKKLNWHPVLSGSFPNKIDVDDITAPIRNIWNLKKVPVKTNLTFGTF